MMMARQTGRKGLCEAGLGLRTIPRLYILYIFTPFCTLHGTAWTQYQKHRLAGWEGGGGLACKTKIGIGATDGKEEGFR